MSTTVKSAPARRDDERLRTILEQARRVEIQARGNASEALVGRYRSAFRGQGLDLDEVREYVPGDDVRRIDWNVTAREGRPFVKKFREERELTILLVVDVSASQEWGSTARSKREVAAEIASVLALAAARSDDTVGLLLFTDEVERFVEPRKGRAHATALVRDVLSVEPRSSGTDLAGALEVARQRLRRRAVIVLVGDFRGEGLSPRAAQALRVASRRHDVVAVVLGDPAEDRLPAVGLLCVEDAETGEILEIDTRSAQVRHAFEAAAIARRDELVKALRRESVDHLQVSTAAPWVPALARFFDERRRRP